MDPITVELAKSFGLAAPVVLFLIWVFRGEREERQQMTQNFLSTLETVAANSLKAITEQTITNRELTNHIEQSRVLLTSEHKEIVSELKILQQTTTRAAAQMNEQYRANSVSSLITSAAH